MSLFAKSDVIADLHTNMRECVCVYCRYRLYESRSDRSDHIYHEIHVENHSSANSLPGAILPYSQSSEKSDV